MEIDNMQFPLEILMGIFYHIQPDDAYFLRRINRMILTAIKELFKNEHYKKKYNVRTGVQYYHVPFYYRFKHHLFQENYFPTTSSCALQNGFIHAAKKLSLMNPGMCFPEAIIIEMVLDYIGKQNVKSPIFVQCIYSLFLIKGDIDTQPRYFVVKVSRSNPFLMSRIELIHNVKNSSVFKCVIQEQEEKIFFYAETLESVRLSCLVDIDPLALSGNGKMQVELKEDNVILRFNCNCLEGNILYGSFESSDNIIFSYDILEKKYLFVKQLEYGEQVTLLSIAQSPKKGENKCYKYMAMDPLTKKYCWKVKTLFGDTLLSKKVLENSSPARCHSQCLVNSDRVLIPDSDKVTLWNTPLENSKPLVLESKDYGYSYKNSNLMILFHNFADLQFFHEFDNDEPKTFIMSVIDDKIIIKVIESIPIKSIRPMICASGIFYTTQDATSLLCTLHYIHFLLK